MDICLDSYDTFQILNYSELMYDFNKSSYLSFSCHTVNLTTLNILNKLITMYHNAVCE